MRRRVLSLVTSVAMLVLLSGCGTWIVVITFDIPTGRLTIALAKVFGEAVGPVTDRPIGAIVVPNGATVADAQFTINGSPVDVEQNVSQTHRDQLQAKLECELFFDPATEHIEFYQTTAPVTTDFTDDFEFSLQPQYCFGSFAYAGSTEATLDACNPVLGCGDQCDIVTGEEIVECGAVPTVSEWGLVVMTVLLLTVATIVLGWRRRRAAVA